VAGDNGTPKPLEAGENPSIAVVVTAEDAEWPSAGGIVGQNRVAAITKRCYSLSALSARTGPTGKTSQQGTGGIAGVQRDTR
jgi:hypothetical protein